MVNFKVLYDACVLYPAPLRDLLMQLATCDLYRAKWSERIHQEWIRNVLKNRPDLNIDTLEKIRIIMNKSVLDCLVENFEDIEQSLKLPDANDNHVLAAAIVSGCDVIVTFNIKDFPNKELDKYGIEAQHPDDFLMHLTDLNINKFCSAVKAVRTRLKNPPKSIDDYLSTLEKQGLPKTAEFLVNYYSLL